MRTNNADVHNYFSVKVDYFVSAILFYFIFIFLMLRMLYGEMYKMFAKEHSQKQRTAVAFQDS